MEATNKTALSGYIQQLETVLARTTDNPKQVKTALQTAAAWAKFFEKRAQQAILYKTVRPLEVSCQVAHIVVVEMALGIPGAMAAILTPAYLGGWTPLETIAKQFGAETAAILSALERLSKTDIQYNTIDTYIPYMDKETAPRSAVLLNTASIICLYCNEIALDPKEKPLQNVNTKLLFELQFFYIPLVHKIRLYEIQTRLADFWLKHGDTLNYYAITAQLGVSKLQREKQLHIIVEEVRAVMQNKGIPCIIKKRTKSIYAIWHKMHKLQVGFNQINDLTAIRIIAVETTNKTLTEEKIICWKILTIISELYKPVGSIMRDWISTPKDNGYESLHLAFQTHRYEQLEVQIRTERMDYIAEYGEATHWKYKYYDK